MFKAPPLVPLSRLSGGGGGGRRGIHFFFLFFFSYFRFILKSPSFFPLKETWAEKPRLNTVIPFSVVIFPCKNFCERMLKRLSSSFIGTMIVAAAGTMASRFSGLR